MYAPGWRTIAICAAACGQPMRSWWNASFGWPARLIAPWHHRQTPASCCSFRRLASTAHMKGIAVAHQAINSVATVFLPVSDQDRSLKFFRDQLGFDVHSDTSYGDEARWVEVVPPGSTTVIALNDPSDHRPGVEPGMMA